MAKDKIKDSKKKIDLKKIIPMNFKVISFEFEIRFSDSWNFFIQIN